MRRDQLPRGSQFLECRGARLTGRWLWRQKCLSLLCRWISDLAFPV